MNQKLLAPITALLILGGILIIGSVLGSSYQFHQPPTQVACTMEAKQCSDGTYVGRTGPNCEFAACPGTQTQTLTFTATPTSGTTPLDVTFHVSGTVGTYSINFGDGGSGQMQPNCQSATNCDSFISSHSYASADTYTAKLTRNGLPLCYGCQPSVLGTVVITVTGTTQDTTFFSMPTSGAAPLRVVFVAGVEWSSAYSVSFGDGTTGSLNNNCDGSRGACGQPAVEHTYTSSGTYSAKLRNTAMACAPADCNVIGTAVVTVTQN